MASKNLQDGRYIGVMASLTLTHRQTVMEEQLSLPPPTSQPPKKAKLKSSYGMQHATYIHNILNLIVSGTLLDNLAHSHAQISPAE